MPITAGQSAPGGDVESSPAVPSESSSHEERGDPLAEMAWPPRVLDSYPLTLLLMGKVTVMLPEEPGSLGVVISLASTASETLTLEPIATAEDEAVIANCDVLVADLFVNSLAGSYRERTLRCIMDYAETFPDRPAGMYEVARGQCRSL